MYVNPFWFGVHMTIVLAIVVLIIFAIINVRHMKNAEDENGLQEFGEAEFKNFLREALKGIASENRFIIGEEVKDRDDSEEEV